MEMIKCNLLEIFPAIRVMKLLVQTKSIASHLANGQPQDFVKKVSLTCNLLCLFFKEENAVSCSTLPIIGDGSLSGFGESFGSQRSITCDRGFHLQGNNTISCLASGIWSQPGRCVSSIRCPTMPLVMNGQIGNGDTYASSRRNIFCKEGYRITGPRFITCLSSGLWTKPGICEVALEGDLRLTNQVENASSEEGILEIYHNGQWGVICQEGFEYLAARVACHQLGYSTEFAAFYATNSTLTTFAFLAQVKCRGGESHLHYCDRGMYGQFECPD